MKTFIPSILCVGLLLAADVPSLRAEPPANAGKVLILEDDRTLEGDVERVGDQFRVRRAVGETWLPADRVLRLCADYAAALDYLRSRSNLQDPDERLRLAQWCLDRDLTAPALVEVKAAADLRPDHPATKQLLERLQHQPPTPPAAVTQPTPEPEPAAPVDLTIEALAQFTTKVQPILMNACAGCHANGKGGSFRLTRVNDGPTLNRKTMQQNLAAVIQQVNPQQPHNSRLLTKSVSLHGDTDKKNPPLANRDAPAYRALEEWVRLTVENNPQLLDRVVALPPGKAPPETKAGPSGFAADPRPNTPPAMVDDSANLPAPVPPPEVSPPIQMPTTAPPLKQPTAAPNDPFDPDEFNRQEHPERTPAPAKKPG